MSVSSSPPVHLDRLGDVFTSNGGAGGVITSTGLSGVGISRSDATGGYQSQAGTHVGRCAFCGRNAQSGLGCHVTLRCQLVGITTASRFRACLEDIVLDLIVSVEEVATELELAAADVAIERRLPIPASGRQVEAIAALTDELVLGEEPSIPEALGAGMGADEEVAILSEVKDKVTEVWADFREWRQRTFQVAEDKLRVLAEKTVETAGKLGVSVEHLLARLQRRVTAALVENAVLPPFKVGAGAEQVTFVASEVTVTSTVKSSPSLASVDLTGVIRLLSGLLSLELDVAVKYGVKS
jgi:hypothetical protein